MALQLSLLPWNIWWHCHRSIDAVVNHAKMASVALGSQSEPLFPTRPAGFTPARDDRLLPCLARMIYVA